MAESTARDLRNVPALIAGRYEPVAKIASGGMATVYLAKARVGAGFEKMVALKCVHPHMADRPEFIEMFLDEARIAARIDHPNVCHVFDAGEDDGTHFIAMEYLHGESLGTLMKAWSTTDLDSEPRMAMAARIIADAAMGLHAAHELRGVDGERLGLVHRDVSPQNIFLTYSGSVKVVDFGIAKAEGRLYETTTGVVRGKLAYMSPEQARAEKLDHRSDVWALGVTLWELLTLRRLFRRDDQIATLNAVLEGEIVPPSVLEPGVPAELDEIVLRALRRSPGERPQTARALADALNRFLASRGAPVGMAELSDHMALVFPKRIAEKDAMARLAEQTPSAVRVRGASAETRPLEQPTVIEALGRAPVDTEAVELPVRSTGRWVAASLALLVCVVGAGITWNVLQDGEPVASGSTPPASSTGSPVAPAEVVPVEVAPVEVAPVEAAHGPAPSETAASENLAASEAPEEPTQEPASPSRRRTRPRVPAVQSQETAPAQPRPVRVVHPSGGWAAFRFDGTAQRSTPTTLASVRPGPHTVELQPFGEGPWLRRSIVVPAGSGPHIVRIPISQAP